MRRDPMRSRRPGGAAALLLLVVLWAGGCKAKPTKIDEDLGKLDESNISAVMKRYRGKVVVLNFWAIWCQPCAKEMPELVAFARARAQRGVVLITVNMTGEDSKAGARRFLDKRGVKPPRFHYTGKRLKAFNKALGISWNGSLPATFLFDKKGTLRWSHLGPLTQKMLDAKVKPLL